MLARRHSKTVSMNKFSIRHPHSILVVDQGAYSSSKRTLLVISNNGIIMNVRCFVDAEPLIPRHAYLKTGQNELFYLNYCMYFYQLGEEHYKIAITYKL